MNVFGWASTAPVYGGVGSGALNDQYAVTDLITGLTNAGLNVNQDLVDFYEAYQAEPSQRGHVGPGLDPARAPTSTPTPMN